MPTMLFGQKAARESQHLEKRVAIEGPIRIPVDSQLFLFNALALPNISRKSLRFRSVLFSIFTALLQLSKDVGANPSTGWFRNSDARIWEQRGNINSSLPFLVVLLRSFACPQVL
jgi:hypothetical protein